MVDLSKRRFWRATPANKINVMRPPWSAGEDDFTRDCTRCGECIKHCPTKVLNVGEGQFPQLDFNENECDFCEVCVTVCPTNAIDKRHPKTAHFYPKILDTCLTQNDIYCRSCGENCEPQAIQFTYIDNAIAKPQIDLDLCIQCGACVSPCPSTSIQFEANLITKILSNQEVPDV